MITTWFVSCSKPTPGAEMSLPTIRSSRLRSSLPRALARRSSLSAAKPTSVWPAGLAAPRSTRKSWVARARAR